MTGIPARFEACSRSFSLRNLALAGTALTALSVAAPAGAATTFDVANEAELRSAILALADGDTINVTADIGLGQALPIIDNDVTINGNGNAIDGNSAGRVFFVESGAVAINNLTIQEGLAQGGAGGTGRTGGGGGLGAGGGLFVNTNATVTLTDVEFDDNSATGGAGGAGNSALRAGGGGGGLGGAGGNGPGGASLYQGGGGGGGFGGMGGTSTGASGSGGGGYLPTDNGGAGTDAAAGSGAGGGGTGGKALYGPVATPGMRFGGGGGGIGFTPAGAGRVGATGGDFGGGGGGGSQLGAGEQGGGMGGFGGGGGGGGGGAGPSGPAGTGGTGGYGGGGGGGASVLGGTYGGAGSAGTMGAMGGGGGAGLGGAVFVRTGGTLIINGGNIGGTTGNSVIGGAGGAGGAGGGAGGAAGSGLFVMTGVTATVSVGMGATSQLSDQVAGGGGLTKTGAGTLVLVADNAYKGGTAVNGGTLAVSSDAKLGNAAGGLSFNGGTLQVTGTSFISTARTITWGAGGGGIDIANAANIFTLNQNIGAGGALTKTGAGTLVLNGTNLQSGLTFGGGTVVVSSDAELGSGELVFDGGTMQADASFTTENDVRLTTNDGTIDINGFNVTMTGIVSNALPGSPGALTKTGAGTLWLQSPSTYTGGTTVLAGELAGDTTSLQGGIVNNATVRFIQNSNGTYAGNMSGSGTLRKSGTGTLTLSGTLSHTSETFVQEGTLNVTGSILGGTGDVSIDPGATLTGTGSIGGTVSGLGTLISDAANPLEVGDYDGTGTFHAIIGPSGPALSVTGAATIVGGVIFVNTMNVDGTLAADQTFTALSAGTGITGEFASITDSSALFDFIGLVIGNDYILRTTAGMTMTDVAQTENQREVAGALQGLGTPSDPDLADAVNELGMLDAAGVQAAYDALASEINADMATPAIGDAQLFQSSLFQRLGTVGGADGQSAFSLGQLALLEADAAPEVSVAAAMAGAAGPVATGVWVRAHGLFGEVNGDDRTGAHDLDHSTAGLMAGYDWALSESAIVGIGVGYAHSDLDLDEVDQEGEIHSYRLAAYGGTRMGALSFRGLVGYAYHDNETERQITIGSFDQTAEGDFAGHEFSAAGELGYLMQLGAVALEPVAGLAVTHLSDESYEESGAGGAGLEIDGRSTTSLRSTLGARATFAPAANFRLSASLAWAHELADTEREVDATFLGGGAAFRIQGAEVSRDSALVGVGLGVALGEGIDLTVGYDGQFGADDTSHGLEARLKIGL